MLADGSSQSSGLIFSKTGWSNKVYPTISGYAAAHRGASGKSAALDRSAMIGSTRRWHVSSSASGIVTAMKPTIEFGSDPLDVFLARTVIPIALKWEAEDSVNVFFRRLPRALQRFTLHQGDKRGVNSNGGGGRGGVGGYAGALLEPWSHQPANIYSNAAAPLPLAWQRDHRAGSGDVAEVVHAFTLRMKSVELLGLNADTVFLLLRLTTALEAWGVSPGLSAALQVAVAERLQDRLDHTQSRGVSMDTAVSRHISSLESPTQNMLTFTRQLRHMDERLVSTSLMSTTTSQQAAEVDLLLRNVAPQATTTLWTVLPLHWAFCVKRGYLLDALELLDNVYVLGGSRLMSSFPPAAVLEKQLAGKYGVPLGQTSPRALQQYRFLRYVLELSSASISAPLYGAVFTATTTSRALGTPQEQLATPTQFGAVADAADHKSSTAGTAASLDIVDRAAASLCSILLDVLQSVMDAGHRGLLLYEEVTLQLHSDVRARRRNEGNKGNRGNASNDQVSSIGDGNINALLNRRPRVPPQEGTERRQQRPLESPAITIPASLVRSTEALRWIVDLLGAIVSDARIVPPKEPPAVLLPLPETMPRRQHPVGDDGGSRHARQWERRRVGDEFRFIFGNDPITTRRTTVARVNFPRVMSHTGQRVLAAAIELHTFWVSELSSPSSPATAAVAAASSSNQEDSSVVSALTLPTEPNAFAVVDTKSVHHEEDKSLHALLEPIAAWCDALEAVKSLAVQLADACVGTPLDDDVGAVVDAALSHNIPAATMNDHDHHEEHEHRRHVEHNARCHDNGDGQPTAAPRSVRQMRSNVANDDDFVMI
ncbi:Hypothetical protein, putative [Bodo saltans]|uniref:Uncharacterized protein n=1 Tax=Bodo saltans TaxID=75058 RepID=A0A0S4JBF9_BODSA|nr:Hypothetical protein, putative [Bodo saltans]|eukprot:CUG87561.1 Hypothetical protein, putative [Bodo saltans]